MIQRIVEPDTCKYPMDGVTVDTESEYELCFDFDDSYGYSHHITATQLAVIKESFHTLAWDVFLTAHNEYAQKHEEYKEYRLKMIHSLCGDDTHYMQAREMTNQFALLSIEDNATYDRRYELHDEWVTEYREACFACNTDYDLDALYALGARWLCIEENTLYTDPR